MDIDAMEAAAKAADESDAEGYAERMMKTRRHRAKSNPRAVLDLIAAHRAAMEENARLAVAERALSDLGVTPDEAKAGVLRSKANQKDAERYRAIRRGQNWSVIDWIGDTLRGDELDAAIDAMQEKRTAALDAMAEDAERMGLEY